MDIHQKIYLLEDMETGEQERLEIRNHLKSCESCQRSYDSFQRARRLLKIESSSSEKERFVSGVLKRVTGQSPRPLPAPSRRSWFVPASLLSIVFTFAVSFYLFWQSPQTATSQDLLAVSEEGDFYQWTMDSEPVSEEDVLSFLLVGDL